MIEYVVYDSDYGDILFKSSDVSECRRFAKSYSSENCTPCTVFGRFYEEFYINGQKSDVQ